MPSVSQQAVSVPSCSAGDWVARGGWDRHWGRLTHQRRDWLWTCQLSILTINENWQNVKRNIADPKNEKFEMESKQWYFLLLIILGWGCDWMWRLQWLRPVSRRAVHVKASISWPGCGWWWWSTNCLNSFQFKKKESFQTYCSESNFVSCHEIWCTFYPEGFCTLIIVVWQCCWVTGYHEEENQRLV